MAFCRRIANHFTSQGKFQDSEGYVRNGYPWPSRGILVAVTKHSKSDYIDWDAGREGYVDVPRTPTYVPVHKGAIKPRGKGYLLSIPAQERLGSLIAAGGTIWATYVATVDYASLWKMQIMPPGPMEVCAVGVLAWLHAKWRRSMKVD